MCYKVLRSEDMHITNESSFNLSEYYCKWIIEPTINVGIFDLCCSLPGLFVNFVFIMVVFRNRHLRKTLSLLVHLSTANLLISLGIMSLGLTDFITSEKRYLLRPYQCFYERPQLTFSIIGMQLQACASILVAAERTVAICFPYQYLKMQKTKIINTAIGISVAFVFVTYGIAVGLSFHIYLSHGMVMHDRCYPSLVSGVVYGSFLYAFPAASGMLAILCYLVILFKELKNKFISVGKNSAINNNNIGDANFAGRHGNRRQFWLVKISCILACSAFLFVVIPYSLLFMGRWRTAGDDDSSYYDEFTSYLRRFVTFALSANSFFGVSFCFCASAELRDEVKSTLMCRKSNKAASMPSITRMTTSSMTKSSSSTYSTHTKGNWDRQSSTYV